jgi:hypothetical protein
MDAPDPSTLARLDALLAIARRIADPKDPLGVEARAELGATTGGSREGIDLALREHLEIDPSAEEIASLVASASSRAHRCHVVLSSTVSVGALRAIALGIAAAPTVLVKPSRRDPALARLFVRELATSDAFRHAGGRIRIEPTVDAEASDVVHAYGSDETLVALGRSLPTGVRLEGHGTGFGIALVGPRDPIDEVAAALARDVVIFDQRGCLSPRLVVVDGPERARTFAEALFRALGATGVPRGRLTQDDAADIRRYVELMRGVGEVWSSDDGVVGLDVEPESTWIGPACRVVHVMAATPSRTLELLAPVARHVTTVGHLLDDDLARAVLAACPGARSARPGRMQHPPFDGPVDRRRGFPG